MAQLVERFRDYLGRMLAWWNHFTIRQKLVMGGGVAAGILTIVILLTVLNQPQYVLLMDASSTKESNQVVELLSAESIKYRLSQDALRIEVLKSDLTKAELLLGANDIQAVGYSIDNVTNGSFSTTESDKQKKYVLYLESRLEKEFIERFDAIETASVELTIPQRDGTLVAEQKENSVSILLKIKDGEEFTEDNAMFLARAVATAVGNKTTENIDIMDTTGNMLFSGSEGVGGTAGASTQLSAKSKIEQQMRSAVARVLLGTNVYSKVEVAPNLVVDFSSK
ncbi:MAG: flagellar M-ring protein FliF, partial [Butyrivibrio sp.]|nr:flagellar M-ring protein FliF [Butyrivibrio sp.]